MIRPDSLGPSLRSAAFAIILAVGATACGDQPAPRAPALAIDSAGVEIVTSDPLNSEAYCALGEEPTLSIGVLEGEEPYMFNWIRGANRLSDGSIAMMNNGSGKIRIFDAGGTHLRSMGGKGEGPGEFRIGRFIWVLPGDTLWVGDYRPWRYHVYASTGEFIRLVALEPSAGQAKVILQSLLAFPCEVECVGMLWPKYWRKGPHHRVPAKGGATSGPPVRGLGAA